MKIAKFMRDDGEVKEQDVKNWDAVVNALEAIGENGISEDETDDEEEEKRDGARVVRCLAQPFMNKKVVAMLRGIDTYEDFMDDLLGNDDAGTRPIPRIFEAAKDDPRTHMIGLPVNVYDGAWYENLRQEEQYFLKPAPEITIPFVVSFSTIIDHQLS